ncbi:Protein CBG27435 [Caenorhabditis briggsae]|uniref:Protein CBG27435 n=1 Tax=Caenorhabditis briggsae TaxID=6238 RepID=B6IK12_CAEBR|nr:Protein CBG27435 [Caenorhabditis briggsae]CAS00242.1 Protein CBG27435 [Caenorhabditis briggsae]
MFKTISDMLSLDLFLELIFLLFGISNLIQGPLGILNLQHHWWFRLRSRQKPPLLGGLGEDTACNLLWMYNTSRIPTLTKIFSFPSPELASNFSHHPIYSQTDYFRICYETESIH